MVEEPKNCTKCNLPFTSYRERIKHTTLCQMCLWDIKWKSEREGSLLLKEVRIPIDDALRGYIHQEIVTQVEKLTKDEEFMKNAIRAGIVKYPEFYKELFSPVIKRAIDGLHLSLNIEGEKEE